MIENFLAIDETSAAGHYQNFYINAWWDEATAPRLVQVRDHRRKFLASHEGPLCALSLLFQLKVRVLPKESRKLVDEINRDGGDRFCAEAHYVNAGGLMLSSVRFLMSGLRLISRTRTPIEVFGELPASVQWLSRQTAMPVNTLQAAVDDFLKQCNRPSPTKP